MYVIHGICLWWLTYKVNWNSVDCIDKSAVPGQPMSLSSEPRKLAFEWKRFKNQHKWLETDALCVPPSLPTSQLWKQNEFLLLRLTWLSLWHNCVKPTTWKNITPTPLISTPLKDRIYCCHASTNLRNAELDQWRQNWPRFLVYNQSACYLGTG